ncbi:MAG: hypothetical protein UR28_C0021G0032 [Candidatus Peregrinibacteria bacterium GW2011_GWF2_33_10]|nr:MAG: hypothetical protein UR28_C0021G0032 [Candidatus Peregrinibacteria bacterium GW2011_GWF2_33_10]OGJ44425.1 MAG: hypothetical protein A2263_01945 [Candidatus Peregrinibacteria bacterium RIFOXYA2_FULL_33_21]OGJ46734.1 MAG: hypothetical protein A2272_03330 [Candidatus Peregrinibacteria bacterium RIFOXYA12_FULL_33_12]OGJ50124.1 MAG: hypothetical protein A2307_04270 [Candidatus Peregrinibacteria bacterium RIFOXYB2_FULL_33_20]
MRSKNKREIEVIKKREEEQRDGYFPLHNKGTQRQSRVARITPEEAEVRLTALATKYEGHYPRGVAKYRRQLQALLRRLDTSTFFGSEPLPFPSDELSGNQRFQLNSELLARVKRGDILWVDGQRCEFLEVDSQAKKLWVRNAYGLARTEKAKVSGIVSLSLREARISLHEE